MQKANPNSLNMSLMKDIEETMSIENGWKQGDALSPLLLNFSLEYAITGD